MKLQKKKNKKIVIFIPSIEFGGVEKNLYILINYLQNIYSKIFVITSSHISKKVNKKKVKIIRPKLRNWNEKNRFLKSLMSLFLIIKNFKKGEAIVISFQSSLFSIFASKLMSWPIIIRLNTSPEKYVNNFLKFLSFKILYKFSDEIIVNSFEFKKKLKKIFNYNSIVVLNPLIKKKFKDKKIKSLKNFKGLKIINIGRLTDQKDHITLLQSIKMIVEEKKINLKLYIIGQGNNLKLLQNFIRKNNLKKNVILYGYKEDAEKYIKNFDLFVLSSKYEGLPNTLIEAQVSNVPIISSNCPTGPKEILLNGKLGILFKTGDYKDLYKKILLFNQNKIIFRKRSLLAQKYLTRFDYQVNLSKYQKIIRKYSL